MEIGHILRLGGLGIAGLALLGLTPLAGEVRSQEPEPPASIEGTVVAAGTGEPLRRARVTLRRTSGRRAVAGASTDAAGTFSLSDIPAGNYRLFVEREGYVEHQYGQLSPNRPGALLVLAPGQRVRDVRIALVPTATIAGRIYNEDGEPAIEVTVRAMRYEYRDGERLLAAVKQTRTNDLGDYRLYWLDPGDYYIAATFEDRSRGRLLRAVGAGRGRGRGGFSPAEPPAGDDESAERAYVDTYYPGTNDPLSASPVTLAAGTEIAGIDVTVLPMPAFSIRGRVVGPDAAAGITTTVAIVPRSDVVASRFIPNLRLAGRGRVSRTGDSTFDLHGVSPGRHTLFAQVRLAGPEGAPNTMWTGSLDIDVTDRHLDEVAIPVEPGFAVSGTVRLEPGSGPLDFSRLRVVLQLIDSLPLPSPNTRVEDDGTFDVGNASRAVYRVVLSGLPEDAYVAAARLAGQDALGPGLAASPDRSGPLDIVVSRAGGRVEGTLRVRPNQSFTGAEIVLVPADFRRSDLFRRVSADQYGRFSFRGIAPGRYRVFAWEDAPTGAYRDPEFVRRFDDMAEAVDVERGGRAQVQPQLIPAGP